MTTTDERIRSNKPAGNDIRTSRTMKDRAIEENREVTDDERVEMFRQQFFNSSLPDLPSIDGWHTCWLTTTNPRDSIHTRMRLGYEAIKPEEGTSGRLGNMGISTPCKSSNRERESAQYCITDS